MQPIWIVDAFTEVAYSGNPAAVMLVNEFPEEAQLIAQEMNLSETVFVKSIRENTYHIRWLTPTVEVALCGHATLAAAHILFEENLIKGDTVEFESLSGLLAVKKAKDGLILDFPLQPIGKALEPTVFESSLGLQFAQINEVVQAHDDIIVAVVSADILISIKPDVQKLSEIKARGVIVTALGENGFDFISRFFAPQSGVNEDPVTGSAHCKLADYWQKRLGKSKFKAFQTSTRGGIIGIQIEGNRVKLKGSAVTVMQGSWKA